MIPLNKNSRMLDRLDWSRDTCLKFIRQVQRHECLWNKNAPGYRNPMMQLDAWISLAKEFGFHYKILRNKWRSLQGSFRHFCNKHQAANGDSPPDWFAYGAMQFLKPNACHEQLVDIGSILASLAVILTNLIIKRNQWC
ncbi:uncharacterized protein LOC118460722 isoform X2 [Anopheles albimanus]|uniref:uncharacterized protein LOC118460722 isoform X2 n=1 Tax=Anopheles albimanus TaxID=7167 RepID=UPI00163F80EA|nr:uncharacterized protein LOC118460722 isoform X2 [Anopheles albimanus]